MQKPVLLIDPEDFFQQLERLLDSKLAAIVQPEQNTDSPEFLSRKQAAEALGVSLGTIDNLARGGIIQKHYLGSVPRFRRDELLKAGQSWAKFQRN